MADKTPRYRFRGSIAPTAEVKRPVCVVRNADTTTPNGQKSTSATIDIFDVIDSWGGWWGISAAEVDTALKQIGTVDTLYVRVNSPGGEATEGVAIANLLRAHAATVRVTNYGLAASAASFIAIAGDTLSMAPGSLLMVHEAWSVAAGNAADFRAEADVLDTVNESVAGLYALKAGGGTAKWRALMNAETWYTPDAAVEAKLADKVGLDIAPGTPAIPVDADELPIAVDVTVEITPAARAAQRFDLSVFRHVPEPIAAFAAPKPPAEAPEQPQPKGAVEMTDEQRKALCASLGLPEDADDTAIQTKVDELAAVVAAEPSEEAAFAALAKVTGLDAEKVKSAVNGARDDKGDKVTLSKVAFEELQANSKLGVEARKQQLDEARDAAIKAAVDTGKISRDRVSAWTTAWDKDPEGVKADLAALEVRFPVGDPKGYAGHDGSAGDGAVFTDDEAAALAALAGTSKEALTR